MKLFSFLIVLTLVLIAQSKNHNCQRRNVSNPYSSGYYYGSGYDSYSSGNNKSDYRPENSEEEEFYQVVLAIVIALVIIVRH